MNNQLKKVMNAEWQRSSTRRMTYQKPRLYHYGLYHDFNSLFSCRQRFMPTRITDGVVKQYLSREESDLLATKLRSKFMKQSNSGRYFTKLRKELESRFDHCLKGARSFDRDWTKLSNEQLIKVLDEYYDLDNKFGAFHWVLFSNVEEILVGAISNLMEVEKTNKSLKSKLPSLARPTMPTPLDMERLSILDCALNDKEDNRLIKKHWLKFSSLPMVDIDYDAYTLEYFIKERDEIRKTMRSNSMRKEMRAINRKYELHKRQNDKYLSSFGVKIRPILEFYQAFANYKDRKPYVRDQISYHVKGLFVEVAKRLRIEFRQALFMTEKELASALRKGLKIKKSELSARIKDSVYLFHDGQVEIITNKKDLAFIDDALAKDYRVKEVKGISAVVGKARGGVAIVLSNSDFGKFKKGDILVASATRPDYVPLMKQAAAVVTDEGGLLSHAAIISRELGVPCVVGTKHATEVFKDGDLVEVDAVKGVVKKV